MILEEIRRYCLSLQLVTEGLKWGDNLCFSVAGKLFLIISLDEIPVAASFKVENEDFESFIAMEGFIQAPYFAKNQWVKILDIENMNFDEWKKNIDTSYNLIKQKLPAKILKTMK
jgi:predicted DNA-binding protein (MmcQ/YjbR family)